MTEKQWDEISVALRNLRQVRLALDQHHALLEEVGLEKLAKEILRAKSDLQNSLWALNEYLGIAETLLRQQGLLKGER